LIFHHLGYACQNLEQETRTFEALGYLPEGPDFSDPSQGVVGRFVSGPGPRLELLTQSEGSTVLEPWLAGGGARMYHIAFETSTMDAEIARLEGAGGRVVRRPTPAVAFRGRSICFVMLPTSALVELIEAPSPSPD
jgi:methylmalonyl-CoA/ethylmalonyl-CoA epimerase